MMIKTELNRQNIQLFTMNKIQIVNDVADIHVVLYPLDSPGWLYYTEH